MLPISDGVLSHREKRQVVAGAQRRELTTSTGWNFSCVPFPENIFEGEGQVSADSDRQHSSGGLVNKMGGTWSSPLTELTKKI